MFCPITPFQVVRIEKFIHNQQLFFPDDHFDYQQPYVIINIECLVLSPFQVVIIEKFIHKQGSFFPDNHFEYLQPYVIFKFECFVP